jgi:hypothetical protein
MNLARKGGIMRTVTIFLLLAVAASVCDAQWVQTNGPYGAYVSCFAVIPSGGGGTNLFAGSHGKDYWYPSPGNGGVFRSTNGAANWSAVDNGLTDLGVYAFAVCGMNLFAGTRWAGIFLSTNSGASWTPVSGCGSNQIDALATFPNGAGGTNLFAGMGCGTYLSTDNGTSWTSSNTPFGGFRDMVQIDSNLLAGTDRGVFISTNNGASWTTTGLTTGVPTLAFSGTNLFAGTGRGVFRSSNNGTNWTAVNAGLADTNVRALVVSPNGAGGTNLFAGTDAGVFLSTDNGTSWTTSGIGLMYTRVRAFAAYPNGAGGVNLFAGTYGGGVFLSTDNGTSWAVASTGLTDTYVSFLDDSGTTLFAGLTDLGVFRYTDNGASWTVANNGLTDLSVTTFAGNGMNFFAGTEKDGVFLSTNSGTNWSAVNSGFPKDPWDTTRYRSVRALIGGPNSAGGTNLFAGTYAGGGVGAGVFLSTNNGASWTAADSGFPAPWCPSVNAFAVYSNEQGGTNLFAGHSGLPYGGHGCPGGVCLSTNNGASWAAVDSGFGWRNWVNALAVSSNGAGGTNLFAGRGSYVNTPELTCVGDVYHSTNNGASWTEIDSGLTDAGVIALTAIGTNLFAGTSGGGVFLTTNNGAIWTEVNGGLMNIDVRSLAISGTNLLAGTYGGGIWRRPLSEMVTGVENKTDLPEHYSIDQNYPNPFNPTTTIRYSLPHTSFVTLSVYNTLGQRVAQLVNEQQQAGYHEAVFRGDGLASGVYFYRLDAGSFTSVKKLILLK